MASPDEVIDTLRELVAPPSLPNDTAAVNIRAMALISTLKSLNRAANNATRLHKDMTAEARHDMDQSHLQLQNLLYEKRHLEREIEKCRQFASVYQDVPLYALDEFKKQAPEDNRTEQILADEHQLMLSRLNFELSERQRLDQRRKELLQQKDELLKQNKNKLNTLDSVKSYIDALTKAASETQKKLDELVVDPPSESS